ncbi:MAG: SDR family NAD(P)-dependent oxidoreductase [Proteobacteria bacterium]|nr:SDR family NAD(P)-dependent oxidoreductase [Pseudomonadota bacterium]
MRFDGRVAIVTGAGRGLGRAYAEFLARRGAAVIVNDPGLSAAGDAVSNSRGPADECVAAIVAAGGTAAASYESVAHSAGAVAIAAQALRDFGRLDVLINNAGIGLDRPFAETSAADFERLLGVHFMGTALMCQAAWDTMRTAGYGRIVNTTSSAIFGYANCSAYAAAKGAILAFSRSLALEGAPANIAVNCISPAAATRMTAGVGMDPAQRAWMERELPPAAVAPVAAYLAHESCTLRGEVLSAAGGSVRRYLIGETAGFRAQDLTPEILADNLARILDPRSFAAFASASEAVARGQALDRQPIGSAVTPPG